MPVMMGMAYRSRGSTNREADVVSEQEALFKTSASLLAIYFSRLRTALPTLGTLKMRPQLSLSLFSINQIRDGHRERLQKAPLSRNVYQSKSSTGVVSSSRTYARAASLICSSRRSSNSRRVLGRGQRYEHSNHHLGKKKE